MPQDGLRKLEHDVRGVLNLHAGVVRLFQEIITAFRDSPQVMANAELASRVEMCDTLFRQHIDENSRLTGKIAAQIQAIAASVTVAIVEPVEPALPPPPPPSKRLRVIVADDELLIRDDLCRMVRSFGHEVVGETGLAAELEAMIERERPDVTVFDVHLPDGDGLTAFRRAVATGLDVAGVAVTGDRGSETESRAIENDVLAYILKPVSSDQLRSAIRLAHAQSKHIASLRAENVALSRAMDDDRSNVERAKIRLGEYPGLHANAAYKFLQKLSKRDGISLKRAAELVLKGEVNYGAYIGSSDGKEDRPATPKRYGP